MATASRYEIDGGYGSIAHRRRERAHAGAGSTETDAECTSILRSFRSDEDGCQRVRHERDLVDSSEIDVARPSSAAILRRVAFFPP